MGWEVRALFIDSQHNRQSTQPSEGSLPSNVGDIVGSQPSQSRKNFLVNWLNEYRTKPQISQNKCSNTLKEVPTLGRHRNQQKLMQHASKERRRSIYKYSGSAPKDHSLEHVLCPTLLTLPCYKPLFAGC